MDSGPVRTFIVNSSPELGLFSYFGITILCFLRYRIDHIDPRKLGFHTQNLPVMTSKIQHSGDIFQVF